ncbi:type II secretion system protein [Chitinimonas arctica]|uniref:Type II secretion system protein n=1 Tax=Chitinimonas arctica TaxID=2594795 RepID=A0A516SGF4_9NEIS|nr:type II secretion system protein [Chitinimonas arctica]QDQ27247.1 type II secretion system protein [Chitinimonas arctica]
MRGTAGFSLLELLVVMALIAMLMGLVGPNFVGQLDRSRQRFALEQFRAQLTQLPRWARLSGQSFTLEKLDAPLLLNNEEILSLPAGWRAQFEPPLLISSTQICSSSRVRLQDEKGQAIADYTLSGPACEPKDQAE